MSNKSLLQKAIQMGAASDQSAGISPEDREEIAAQIEELTRKNRIDVGAERFVLKPLKHGFILPLVVNILALGGTGGALWGISALFGEREAELYRTGVALSSAEGKLIQELKRDSESRLTEKDKEITDIQNRLAAMEKERNNLQASFAERLSVKEAELRSRLEEELEKERARLLAEGLSEALIQERLKKFEEERLAVYRAELDEYKKQLDAERTAAEENFSRLRDEYRSNINSLNDERKRILEDSRRREEELRASLEAKTRDLESRTAAAAGEAQRAVAGLEQAKVELARIEEQRKTAAATEDRIVGLYSSVQAAFQERNFDTAATRAAALGSYLEDPAVATLPSLRTRRQADLFAADTLGRLARVELERAQVDTTVLLGQAELVAAIRSLSSQARTALSAGDGAQAARAYESALARIPEIMEAHEYFTRRLREEDEGRRAAAAAALAEARAAAAAADFPASAAAYYRAATALGLPEADARVMVDGIGAMGVDRVAADRRSSDTRSAQAAMARAKREYDAGRWAQAASAYAEVPASYPQADQKPEALKGLDASLTALTQSANTNAQETLRRNRELEAQVASLTEELRRERETVATQTGAIQTGTARIQELERLLERARQETAAAAAVPAPAVAAAAAPAVNASLEQDMARLRQDNERLSLAAQRYDGLTASYTRYAGAEDAVLARSSSSGMVEARNQLEAFLTDGETRRAFPDLRERISRYEREFVAAGQRESIYNAMAIAEGALGLRDAAARERYFSDVASRYAADADMTAYIQALKRGLR